MNTRGKVLNFMRLAIAKLTMPGIIFLEIITFLLLENILLTFLNYYERIKQSTFT